MSTQDKRKSSTSTPKNTKHGLEPDPLFDKIIELGDQIASFKTELNELKDKKVVMAIGGLGVGKSTFMNALI